MTGRADGGADGGGRGPADPAGYSVTAGPQGWVWTRRADGDRSQPHPSRAHAASAARAHRDRPAPADPFDLQRFVVAQDADASYVIALRELRAGRKRTHWVWFVLPQLAGLGHSTMAQRYGLSGLDEARAYLAHPVLGPRLVECARALLDLPVDPPANAEAVLGPVDAAKLRSSMTLFAVAAPHELVFDHLLDRYFAGERDEATTSRL